MVRHAVCWLIKRIYLNNVSRNRGSFTSNGPSLAPCMRLSFRVRSGLCRRWESLGVGGGLTARAQADTGWQRPGNQHILWGPALRLLGNIHPFSIDHQEGFQACAFM